MGQTRANVELLLEAMAPIGRGLDLETTLRQIVTTAAGLVDARYAALGVLGDDGTIVRFLTVGLSSDQVRGIGEQPASVGLLADRSSDRSTFGVPLQTHGAVFGNLYLAEKCGGGRFTTADRRTIEVLAANAGVAIENATLHDEALLRERSARANDDVSRAALTGAPPQDVLRLIADHAREVAMADLAVVAVSEPGADGLVVAAAAGAGSHRVSGMRLVPSGTFTRTVLASGAPLVSTEATAAERVQLAFGARAEIGPIAAVPIGEHPGARGAVVAARHTDAAPFSSAIIETVQQFSARTAVALEAAQRRADAERLAVMHDRERIARDLHDLVVQRLFATGLALHAFGRQLGPETTTRVEQMVDDIDETIALIRTTVHRLRSGSTTWHAGVRTRVLAEAEVAAATLGFSPRVRFDGPVDTSVPPDIAEHVLAVVREALSNVARHAQAHQVGLRLAVKDDVLLTVTDDGHGIPPKTSWSGLRNLGGRAADLGGSLRVRPAPGGGTRLEWRVPLPDR